MVNHDNPVSAFTLGTIESSIGVAEQELGGLTILGEDSRPDGDRDAAVQIVIEFGTEIRDCFADHLGPVEGVFGSDVGQDDGELFATVPADQIFGSYAGAEGMGDLFQNGVSGRVAELVVQFFEVIDIHHQNGERSLAPAGARELAFESDLEEMTIKQAGESIANGLVLQLLPHLEGSKRHCGELDELANTFRAAFNDLPDRFVGTADVEDTDRVAMSDEGDAEITARSGSDEVVAVDLRGSGSMPMKLPRTQAAAGLWREDLGDAGADVVGAPAGYGLDHVSGAVDDAEGTVGAGEQPGETECGGAVDLGSIGAELQIVAGDG